MSKASQRRQAAKRKRETDVRGSTDKRMRMLLEQEQRWDSPVRWWRDCIKHLPADEVTQSTKDLRQAVERARRMIEIAATGWTAEYDVSEDIDSVMPGFLMPIHQFDPPRFGIRPLSLFGRAVSEETNLIQAMLDDLPLDCDAGLWVFGCMATARGETFVLAAHRDGTRTAAVRVQGQWLDTVPTAIVRQVAHLTAALMVDEGATEAISLMAAVALPREAWDDVEERARWLRDVTSDSQQPYLQAWWRMAMNQFARETVGEMEVSLKDYVGQMMARHSSGKEDGDVARLREQLASAQAREKTLQRDLRLAQQQQQQSPSVQQEPPKRSPGQRMASIF